MSNSSLLMQGTKISQPTPSFTERLQADLPDFPFHIASSKADELASKLGISKLQLMVELIPLARPKAPVPVSDYRVGSCAMGASGDLYLGVNIEFNGVFLGQTVHSEQCATTNAMCHMEKGLQYLAVSSEPCGYCRQFLNEMTDAGKLVVLIPDKEAVTLADLLPRSFGPGDLGVEAGMLSQTVQPMCLENKHGVLADMALEAANHSYAPYSNCGSGVAIETKDGKIIQGWYAENAAFNPSLPPMQAALIMLLTKGIPYSEIERAVLVQKVGTVSQEHNTKALLAAVAPDAALSIYYIN